MVVQRAVVVEVARPRCRGRGASSLADVAAEPDRLAADDLLAGRAASSASISTLRYFTVPPLDDVAEVLDRERAPVRAGRARVVHEADVLVDRQRRRTAAANSCGVISPSRWNLRSLSVHCQSKRSRRRAEVDAEDAVDHARGSRSFSARRSSVARRRERRAASCAPSRSLSRRIAFMRAGRRRALRLRHERLRHEAVLARPG